MKTVYCIIVTFNGMQWIGKCLHSLVNSSYPSRILVIDNASTDTTVSFIRNSFPSVQLIESGMNAGFGQANNTGLKIALENEADYVFLLNQDAWVETETISELIKVLIENPEFGIVSPVHFNGTGKELDKYFLDYFNRSDNREITSSQLTHPTVPSSLIKTNFVNAAAWLISADCLRKTGGFDPIFFHYGEDINYAQRADYGKFYIGIYTGTKIYHDRQDRISKTRDDWRSLLKKDYVHFLNQVCDIRQKHYRKIIVKRVLRYSYLAFLSLVRFNKDHFYYSCGMARKILLSVSKIRKSRKESAYIDSIPHF